MDFEYTGIEKDIIETEAVYSEIKSSYADIAAADLTETEIQDKKKEIEQKKEMLKMKTNDILTKIIRKSDLNVSPENVADINDAINSVLDKYSQTDIKSNFQEILYECFEKIKDSNLLTDIDSYNKTFDYTFGSIIDNIKNKELKKIKDDFNSKTQPLLKKIYDLVIEGGNPDEITSNIQKVNDLLIKLEKDVTEFLNKPQYKNEWKDLKFSIIKTFLICVIIAGAATGIGVIGYIFMCKFLSTTGCYIYTSEGSSLLTSCGITEENCKCGIKVDKPLPADASLCNSLDKTECITPYCMGLCNNSYNKKCLSNQPYLFQCSKSDISDSNFITYYYQDMPASQYIPNLLKNAKDTANTTVITGTKTIYDAVSSLINKYWPILLVIFIIIIAIIILFIYSVIGGGASIIKKVNKK